MVSRRCLAFGVVSLVALGALAVASESSPWNYEMKPVVVRPSDSGSEVVKALSLVADYDIYRDPVIVQAAWSRQTELTIVFFAQDDPRARRKGPRRPPWEIRVLFGENGLARHPRVVARGIARLGKGKSDVARARLGRAVAVAVANWDEERRVDLPQVIQADSDTSGYGGLISRLPLVPGGYVVFDVSTDMSKYRITPGL